MAKKPLGDAGSSKLARRDDDQEKLAEAPRLLAAPPRQKPTSFKLSGADLKRFERLKTQMSLEAGRPVTRSDVLRGLLLLGEKTEPKRMLAAIKDAAFESL